MSHDQRSHVRELEGRVFELESQVVAAKVVARRLWAALSVRVGFALDVLLEEYDSLLRRVVDVEFDAAQIVWERHRIVVVPCRVVIDPQEQHRDFFARYPNGEGRNVSRDQLLMMAGMDPSDAAPADPFNDAELPF